MSPIRSVVGACYKYQYQKNKQMLQLNMQQHKENNQIANWITCQGNDCMAAVKLEGPSLGECPNLPNIQPIQIIKQNVPLGHQDNKVAPGYAARPKERTRVKAEIWSHWEVKKIFRLYTEYGSQWKIMESQFADRPANSIKNRFYTVVRTMLKTLFKWHPLILCKLPHEIPSKSILKFYEGRQEFSRFRGLGKRVLKMVDYDIESPQMKIITQENQQELLELYKIIFDKNTLEEIHGGKNVPAKKGSQPASGLHCSSDQQQIMEPREQQKQQARIQTCASLPDPGYNPNYEGMIFFVPITDFYGQGFIQCYPLYEQL